MANKRNAQVQIGVLGGQRGYWYYFEIVPVEGSPFKSDLVCLFPRHKGCKVKVRRADARRLVKWLVDNCF